MARGSSSVGWSEGRALGDTGTQRQGRLVRLWPAGLVIVTVLFSVVGFKLVQHLTTTTVPLVMGRTVAEAREALRDTGLDLGMVSYSEDGAGAAGAVIAQSPRAGQRVKPGTSIMVVVLRTAVAPSLATTTPSSPATSAPKSKTPAALRVPSLRGLDTDKARERLKAAAWRFDLGRVNRVQQRARCEP